MKCFKTFYLVACMNTRPWVILWDYELGNKVPSGALQAPLAWMEASLVQKSPSEAAAGCSSGDEN